MSYITGTASELIYANTAAAAAISTFTGSTQINPPSGPMGVQAHLPSDFWLPNNSQRSRTARLVAKGILSSTGTPTYQWFVVMGAAGAGVTSQVGVTTAITTTSSVTNAIWQLELDIIMQTVGAAGVLPLGQDTSISGVGTLISGGLATPVNAVWAGGGAAGVFPGVTSTVNTSIPNFFNLFVACSASSASNTVTLLQLLLFGMN